MCGKTPFTEAIMEGIMIREIIFASPGALIFTAIVIILTIMIYHRVLKKKYFNEKASLVIVTVLVCLVLILSTWIVVARRYTGAERSRVDRGLIAELTEEKIDLNLPKLSEHEWVWDYRENDGGFEHVRSYGFDYRRPTAPYEEPTGTVSFFMFVYKTEEAARRNIRSYDYKYDYYKINGNDAYLGRSVITRSADTFFVGGTGRFVMTRIRVGRYVLIILEDTFSNHLNDLKTNDVLRILAGVE
jgi:hypothetical protein